MQSWYVFHILWLLLHITLTPFLKFSLPFLTLEFQAFGLQYIVSLLHQAILIVSKFYAAINKLLFAILMFLKSLLDCPFSVLGFWLYIICPAELERNKFRDQFLYKEQELSAAKGREQALQEQQLKEVHDFQERFSKQIQSYSELEV